MASQEEHVDSWSYGDYGFDDLPVNQVHVNYEIDC